ncbi:MAG: phosphatidylglycerophosphatase A [Gammaproteobacteria bacterium]|nr:phosphatidylglycerophosphatase A [Gammaproteobacteria bacterium]MDH5304182.1 phosphatidylglycerophosphatase A [Gammaproteobacteria bacterium]MDH5321579.1 phosphatidylglycerophosphatase A [Gammaproteobacteria bacterium]
MFTDPVHVLAFGLGLGLVPLAPGTAGTLLGVLLAWLALDLGLAVQIALGVMMFVAGIWICDNSSRRLGQHDPGGIVWDEISAMYFTLLTVPPTIAEWCAAFVLFRVFDILKPWPIRDLDHRMGGGLGIMLDDLVAALYAAILLVLYRWLMT